jgi:hypothetical protein
VSEEHGVCPSCGQQIPIDRLPLHLDGLDGARPECPRQDLKLIVQRASEAERLDTQWPRGSLWMR